MAIRSLSLTLLFCSARVFGEFPASPESDYFRTVSAVESQLVKQLADNLQRACAANDRAMAQRYRDGLVGYLWEGAESPAVRDLTALELREQYAVTLKEAERKLLSATERDDQTELPARPGWLDCSEHRFSVLNYHWESNSLGRNSDGELPDLLTGLQEHLRVSIAGTRTQFDTTIRGHLGKLLVFPAAAKRGFFAVRQPTVRDATTYHFCVLREGEIVLQHSLKLQIGELYSWTVLPDAAQNRVTIAIDRNDFDGETLHQLVLPSSDAYSIGLGATVRYPQNVAELSCAILTFDAARE